MVRSLQPNQSGDAAPALSAGRLALPSRYPARDRPASNRRKRFLRQAFRPEGARPLFFQPRSAPSARGARMENGGSRMALRGLHMPARQSPIEEQTSGKNGQADQLRWSGPPAEIMNRVIAAKALHQSA